MHLESRTRDGALIIEVEASRIDAASAIHLKDQFRNLVESSEARVIMDISKVEFMDSSGLGAMVAALKMLEGKPLEIVNLSPAVEKVFTLTRMDQVFKIHKDLDAALSSDDAVDAA